MLPELNEIGFERSGYIFYIQVVLFTTFLSLVGYGFAKTREDYLDDCAKDELNHEN